MVQVLQVPNDINRSSSNFEWLGFEVFGGVVRRPSTYPRQGFTSLLQLGIWAKWLAVQNSYDGRGSLLGHHWIILLWRWFSVEVLVVAPLVFTSFHHVFENLFMPSTSIHHSLPIVFFESRVSGYGSETRLVEPIAFLAFPVTFSTCNWCISYILGNLQHFISGAGRIHSWGFRHNQLGDESCQILATQLSGQRLHVSQFWRQMIISDSSSLFDDFTSTQMSFFYFSWWFSTHTL